MRLGLIGIIGAMALGANKMSFIRLQDLLGGIQCETLVCTDDSGTKATGIHSPSISTAAAPLISWSDYV